MKKIILLIICCLFSAATTVLAQGSGKIFLQHNGTITKIYDNDGISKAIEAAAEGDTLYLSSGNFNGGITINKSIAIIGTSATGSNSSNFTWDGGDAIIQTENEKTISSIYIEGVSFNRSLNFNSNVKAFSAKKCYLAMELTWETTLPTRKKLLLTDAESTVYTWVDKLKISPVRILKLKTQMEQEALLFHLAK